MPGSRDLGSLPAVFHRATNLGTLFGKPIRSYGLWRCLLRRMRACNRGLTRTNATFHSATSNRQSMSGAPVLTLFDRTHRQSVSVQLLYLRACPSGRNPTNQWTLFALAEVNCTPCSVSPLTACSSAQDADSHQEAAIRPIRRTLQERIRALHPVRYRDPSRVNA